MLGVVLVSAVLPGSVASAGGGVITSFTDSSIDRPTAITSGPDGALWFTNEASNSIGRMTTAGVVTNYPGAGINPYSITLGPDGALWFTTMGNCFVGTKPCDPGSIGRITTSGVIANYTDPTIVEPQGIAAGPDGALWFSDLYGASCPSDCGSIGRITTNGVVSNFTSTIPNALYQPEGITAGPDGALWYANYGQRTIGRITTSGAITAFTDTVLNTIRNPASITSGPDGALWFTNSGVPSIGRITTSGAVSRYAAGGAGISAGPDGALWYGAGTKIARLTTSGTETKYTDPSINGAFDTAPGPDGNVWFVNYNSNSIDRVTTSYLVTTSPTLGPAGTTITISGAGFVSGETVKVKYLTGRPAPKSILLCTTTAASDGTFSCPATIPTSAGSAGTHTIKAEGATSGTVAKTLFLRTT
jgi:virginiamycin B lyase